MPDMLNQPRMLALVSALASCSLLGTAQAGGRDFIVYTTRLGGDAETAQPYIDRFASHLEGLTGFPKSSLKGRFAPGKKEALAFIESQKPGFGVLEPSLYLELRKSHNLSPIADVNGKDLNSPNLHVVVKDPAVKGLDDLKGKKLWTHLADVPSFLGQVVLDGKEPPDKRFALKQVSSALKAARAVLRGEADAAILDDEQLAAAKKMEGGDKLRSVFDSATLPPVVAVMFGGSAAADQKALAKSLLSLCASKGGADICKEMHIENFTPPNAAVWSAAQKRYEAAPGGK
jgi:ABC-type phosphate/phosphonate transport system substrate-binding protein